MKKLVVLMTVCLIASIVPVPSVFAADDAFTVTIGEDKVFTEFNCYEVNSINPGSLPGQRTAVSEGSEAIAALTAAPGQSGMAEAWIGLQFSWDMQQYSWEEIKNWPVTITVDYSYRLAANWVEDNGSANAFMRNSLYDATWYDGIGYEEGRRGEINRDVREEYTLTAEDIELKIRKITFYVYAQVHCTEEARHSASAQVRLNSIEIKFDPGFSAPDDEDEAAPVVILPSPGQDETEPDLPLSDRMKAAGITVVTVDGVPYYDYTVPVYRMIGDNTEEFIRHRNDKALVIWFWEKMDNHGPWDIKYKKQWIQRIGVPYPGRDAEGHLVPFVFDGTVITADTLGNMIYGYWGTLLGFDAEILFLGGGYAAIGYKAFFAGPPNYGETQNDHDAIQRGIDWYKRENDDSDKTQGRMWYASYG